MGWYSPTSQYPLNEALPPLIHAQARWLTPLKHEAARVSSGIDSDNQAVMPLDTVEGWVPSSAPAPKDVVLETLRAQWKDDAVVQELIARKKRNVTESDSMDGPLMKVVYKVWEIKRSPHPNGSAKSIFNQHIGALLLCQADWVGQCITIAALLEQYGAGRPAENAAVIALTAPTARPRGIASFWNELRGIVDQIQRQARVEAGQSEPGGSGGGEAEA
ncbi:hypothetical protein K439DRAFT_1619722 [Ramaria rubella]|nr:hypothetical protein K439DRAFT_1619722 [Ramaria rubella]